MEKNNNDLEDSIKRILNKLDRVESMLESLLESKIQGVKPATKDEVFSVKEAAIYMNCPTHKILKMRSKGELAFFQPGRKIYIWRSDLDRLSSNLVKK